MKFETYLKVLEVVICRKMLATDGKRIERYGSLEIKLEKKLLTKFWQVEQKVWDLEQEIENLKRQHERELENAEKEAFERGFDEAFEQRRYSR